MIKECRKSISFDEKVMKAENGNKKGFPWELIVSVLITMILCVVMVLFCYGTVEKMLWQERGTNLNNTMEKISQCINLILGEQWNNLDAYSKRLENEQPITLEHACSILEKSEKERSREGISLLLFNDRNRYYDSAEIERQWFLDSVDSVEGRMAYVGSFVQYETSMEQIVFVQSLEKPMRVSGETFTHMGLVCSMQMLDEAISDSAYGDGSSVYIIESDGTQIYHQAREDSIFNVYNIIRTVEKYHYLYGSSWEQFRNDIQDNAADCVHLEKDAIHYIVAYHPIVIRDWHVILVLPGEMVGASTAQFARSMMLYFFGIFLITMTFLVITIHIFDRRFRKTQEETNEKLQAAVQAEKEANAAKRKFLSHMSHDIRTPINAILGMLNIVRKNSDNQEIVDNALNKISEAAKHLLSLISDIWDVSRIESGKIEIQNERLKLNQLLDECVAIIEGHLEGRTITFTQDFSKLQHKNVMGDGVHLRQIILNILGNAVRYTPDGKSISFRIAEYPLEDGKAMFQFEMEDTGIGMKQEFLKNIFEPFVQENNGARTEYSGSGLGMAIVKQLVELMHGTITVKSVLNEGTLFTVSIPMEYRDECEQIAEEKEFEPAEVLHGMKVLIVEDNSLNLEISCFILREAGIEVTPAMNGEQALNIFRESAPEDFDVILMDVMMPVMDGLEATKAIRALPRPDAQSIPIIAMTAKAFIEDMEKTREAGMNAHLTKPINECELYRKLAEYAKIKREN